MAKKKKVPKPDTDGFLDTGIYRRDCRPRKSMTPHEYLEYIEERILNPPPRPTIHEWLDQHLKFFGSILLPYVKRTPGSGELLNIGDGWHGYRVADDLDEPCRDAIDGIKAIDLLQRHVDADGKLADDGGKMDWVIQQSYNLGRIVERINAVRPFELLVMSERGRREGARKAAEVTNEAHTELHSQYQPAVDRLMSNTGCSYSAALPQVASLFGVSDSTVKNRRRSRRFRQ